MTTKEIRYKIDYEIIVDCYDDYEVNMSWYYFFEDTLEFPFEAKVFIKTRNGKINLTKVDVLGMATEDSDFADISEISFDVSPKDSEIVMDIRISKLKQVKGNEAVKEAFEIWTFWKSGKY